MSRKKARLKSELKERLSGTFHMDRFVLNTMDSFCYRYLDSRDKSAQPSALQVTEGVFRAEFVEEDVEKFLTTMGEGEVAKRIRLCTPKGLLSTLSVELSPLEAKVCASLNWDAPHFFGKKGQVRSEGASGLFFPCD